MTTKSKLKFGNKSVFKVVFAWAPISGENFIFDPPYLI